MAWGERMVRLGSMKERTADLKIIRERPSLFVWGKIVKIHDVGRYTIVEHDDYPATNANRESERSFYVYVNGKDTHTSAPTMEQALLHAIAEAFAGHSAAHHAAFYAGKVLGVERG